MQDIVLCKVYRKATSLKVLEQRAALEEEMKNSFHVSSVSPPSPLMDTFSFCSPREADQLITPPNQMVLKKEVEEVGLVDHKDDDQERDAKDLMEAKASSSPTLRLPFGKNKLPEIQVPKNMDWTQDPFWTQLTSPWLQSLTPYTNIMNF